MKGKIFRNKKNGKLYKILYEAIDCTNHRDEEKTIVYTPVYEDGEVKIFVREKSEFIHKFELA